MRNKFFILTDLFGGTPHNLALTQLDPGRVEVVSGANLPMLLALDGLRSEFKNVADLAPAIAKKAAVMRSSMPVVH